MRSFQKYFMLFILGVGCCMSGSPAFSAEKDPQVVQKYIPGLFNVRIVPIHTIGVQRSIPWAVNESVDLQVFVDPDPGVDSTQYRCYYELYCEDAVTEKCPMSEFVCSEFYQIVIFPNLVPLPNIVPPRVGCKYTIRVVFENKVTSMRHYVDYPFEYVEKDVRVIGIGLYTRQDKYTTPVFHQGEEFRLLGFCCANRNPGDEVKLTISSAYPKIETMPAADEVLRMGFKSSKLGRDVIHVELENVTQGRKAVYDLPYLIIENPLYPYNQNKITDELIHATLYPSKQ